MLALKSARGSVSDSVLVVGIRGKTFIKMEQSVMDRVRLLENSVKFLQPPNLMLICFVVVIILLYVYLFSVACGLNFGGSRGVAGVKGETGEKGEKGEKGQKGEKGERGERCLEGANTLTSKTVPSMKLSVWDFLNDNDKRKLLKDPDHYQKMGLLHRPQIPLENVTVLETCDT